MKYILSFGIIFLLNTLIAKDIYISPSGNDSHLGTETKPFVTLDRAIMELRKFAGTEAVTIWFDEGTYYLEQGLTMGSKLSGTPQRPVLFTAKPGAKVTIKGSVILDGLRWREYKNGIFAAKVKEGLQFDQMFVNGERQVRARFPNFDYQNPIRGGKGYQKVAGGTDRRYDEWFIFNPEEFTEKEWQNPGTGIVHAFQSHNWGNMQYRIKGIDRTENMLQLGEGGWQLQRAYGIGGKGDKMSWFYVENIFEELDAPGEWFLDTERNLLFYYPKAGINLEEALFEVPVVKDLIRLTGNKESPVRNITFRGFHFTHSTLLFLESYEPVARGDWAIHRGGAVFLSGAENCTIEDCSFEYLGGNGVFMSGYNRNNRISGCKFVHTGESAVCFVGSPSSVRFYQTWDDREILGKDWDEMREGMDLEPGPRTPDYPKNCVVENCIMHDFGDYGKQVAGVYISMSHKIRVSHNTIYNCPRAGICINDGTWGGHIIENCDLWETVRETGEHGPFNSWGRERQWRAGGGSGDDMIKEYVKLDAIDPTILRNNRIANFRKSISAGTWTIDLDDGSSFYEIYNNLNLGSTIKLRDGMFRKVYNNITVSAVPLGWHVWPDESEDEVYQNIFVISGIVPGGMNPTNRFIRPVKMPQTKKWSNNYNYNLYWNVNFADSHNILENKTMEEWQAEGYDRQSIFANPLFVDPLKGDYRVKENSPALKLGFKNFPMNKFGHQMTRIIPFGGEFDEEAEVTMIADARMVKGGILRYTIDGSEPTRSSPMYNEPIKLQRSAIVKACSFDLEGNPVGFTCVARFKKMNKLTYPSWFSTLLSGRYIGLNNEEEQRTPETEINGILLSNIADDPDLIDASGGYNYGCYVKAIDPDKGKMWLDAGLRSDWIIQKFNDNEILNIADLQRCMKNHTRKTVTITAVKNYYSEKFVVEIK